MAHLDETKYDVSKVWVQYFFNVFADILSIVEHMKHGLETCRKNLLHHLERRRQIFPRFYFLSMEDVLHIVCNGKLIWKHIYWSWFVLHG